MKQTLMCRKEGEGAVSLPARARPMVSGVRNGVTTAGIFGNGADHANRAGIACGGSGGLRTPRLRCRRRRRPRRAAQRSLLPASAPYSRRDRAGRTACRWRWPSCNKRPRPTRTIRESIANSVWPFPTPAARPKRSFITAGRSSSLRIMVMPASIWRRLSIGSTSPTRRSPGPSGQRNSCRRIRSPTSIWAMCSAPWGNSPRRRSISSGHPARSGVCQCPLESGLLPAVGRRFRRRLVGI